MKLIDSKTKQPLVNFHKKTVTFYNKYLEQEMQIMGIPVPHGLRGLFGGKDIIFLGDPEFEKAFREIYYLTSVDPSRFHWMD